MLLRPDLVLFQVLLRLSFRMTSVFCLQSTYLPVFPMHFPLATERFVSLVCALMHMRIFMYSVPCVRNAFVSI